MDQEALKRLSWKKSSTSLKKVKTEEVKEVM